MVGNWLKEEEKKWYVATFMGYGIKRQRSWSPTTIALFKDLKIKNGDYISPRAWSNATQKITKLQLKPLDKIKFQAKIQKHSVTRKKAYKITHISRTDKIGHVPIKKEKKIVGGVGSYGSY
jgi:hypothetical protein